MYHSYDPYEHKHWCGKKRLLSDLFIARQGRKAHNHKKEQGGTGRAECVEKAYIPAGWLCNINTDLISFFLIDYHLVLNSGPFCDFA